MFEKLKKMLRAEARNASDPEERMDDDIRELAEEIRELAEAVGRINSRPKDFMDKIDRITTEMAQLEKLTLQREFRQLSSESREKLRKSLIKSRSQLLDSVRSAPVPTDIVQ